MRRATPALALTAALVAATLSPGAASAVERAPSAPATPPAPAAAPAATTAVVGEPAWDVCEFVGGSTLPENYQCARFPVPLDHAEPAGETVELQLVRRLADDPGNRLGSLFINPGGPGGSGFDFVAGGVPEFLYDPEVLARYDVVGFDPRGIALSEGLQCFTGEEDARDFTVPFVWPETRREERELRRVIARTDRLCDRNASDVIDHMSTTDVARDLDLLRQAVGDEQLNFVGYSYGSAIAAYYANLFPDNVGAVVADGVLDPVAWATGRDGEGRSVPLSARLGSDVGAQDTLDEFFRLCDEAGPEVCPIAGGAEERFTAVLAGLEATPIVLGPTVVIDHQLFTSITLGDMYNSGFWFLTAADTALFEEILADQGTLADPRTQEQVAAFSSRIPLPYLGPEQFTGVTCSDATNPRSLRAWRRAAAESTGVFGPIWAWNDAQCSDWPGRDRDRYTGPFDAETANPVLVASTRYDPATAYSGALALKELLPSAALLTVEGWGHTTPLLSACADAVTTQYLLTRTTEAEEITCTQDVGPFDLVPFEAGSAATPGATEAQGVPADRTEAAELTATALTAAGEDELADRARDRAAYLEQLGPSLLAGTATE